MEILRGRELDAKIAKFEGWVWVYKLQESEATLMDEDEAVYRESIGEVTYDIPVGAVVDYDPYMPEWSRDIAYAFDLMDNADFRWETVERDDALSVWCCKEDITVCVSVNLAEFGGREDAYATAYCNAYLKMLGE